MRWLQQRVNLKRRTQYKGELKLIHEFYTAIGFCNEKIKLYVATNLKPVENPRPLDEDEFLEIYELTYEEVYGTRSFRCYSGC